MTIAKEKGLEPLANIILLQMTDKPLEQEAEAFINPEKEVNSVRRLKPPLLLSGIWR